MLWLLAFGVLVPGLLAGCASDAAPTVINPEDDLFHTNPSRRTAAVAVVEQNRQTEFVPMLIEMLDDPDPAVRMVAVGTLEELTGRTSEYRAYASANERRAHRDEWRAWHQSQTGARVPFGPVFDDATTAPQPTGPTSNGPAPREIPPPPPLPGAMEGSDG